MRATGRYDVPVVDSRSRKKVNGKIGLFQGYFRSVFSNSTSPALLPRSRRNLYIQMRTYLYLLLQSEALIRLMLGSEH